jgi:hypothetical protein
MKHQGCGLMHIEASLNHITFNSSIGSFGSFNMFQLWNLICKGPFHCKIQTHFPKKKYMKKMLSQTFEMIQFFFWLTIVTNEHDN